MYTAGTLNTAYTLSRGGVRWVRTNPLFADSLDLLVPCYSQQCSTLSVSVQSSLADVYYILRAVK